MFRSLPAVALLVLGSGCRHRPISLPPPIAFHAIDRPASPPKERPVSVPGIPVVPGDAERMLLVLTNLARHSPTTPRGNACGDWTQERGDSPPLLPLVYVPAAQHAGDFSAEHLAQHGCFQHASCCVLGEVNGRVQCVSEASCAGKRCKRQCSGGTSALDRYTLVGFPSVSGENIAVTQPGSAGPAAPFDVWCAWMRSDSHRLAITSKEHTALGIGRHRSTGEPCQGDYWVQSFGRGTYDIPRVPAASAVFAPSDGVEPGASVSFLANYFDASGAAPTAVYLRIEERCVPLTRHYGVEGNGTYEAVERIAAGAETCRPYHFEVRDAQGTSWRYPPQGELALPAGRDLRCSAAGPTGSQSSLPCLGR
jgi:hypothetical protein